MFQKNIVMMMMMIGDFSILFFFLFFVVYFVLVVKKNIFCSILFHFIDFGWLFSRCFLLLCLFFSRIPYCFVLYGFIWSLNTNSLQSFFSPIFSLSCFIFFFGKYKFYFNIRFVLHPNTTVDNIYHRPSSI